MNTESQIIKAYLKKIHHKAGQMLTHEQQKELRLELLNLEHQQWLDEAEAYPEEALDEAFDGIYYNKQTGKLL